MLTLEEFRKLMIDAADCLEARIFDHVNFIRDWKTLTPQLFKNLPGFRKKFYYSSMVEGEHRYGSVVVKT